MNIFLPQVALIEEEREKLTIGQLSGSPVQEPIKSTDAPVDPLRDNFEQLPDLEGRLKRVRQESAAIRHLCSGEGVMSTKPMEIGQLPKGVQPGFIEEIDYSGG